MRKNKQASTNSVSHLLFCSSVSRSKNTSLTSSSASLSPPLHLHNHHRFRVFYSSTRSICSPITRISLKEKQHLSRHGRPRSSRTSLLSLKDYLHFRPLLKRQGSHSQSRLTLKPSCPDSRSLSSRVLRISLIQFSSFLKF
jgi:hypothetical protein